VPITPEQLLARLDELGIATVTHRHAPAFTVEQGNAVWGAIPGVHCKNLFLKDAKARLWLVVAPADRRVDLKRLPERIGSARLSFGSAELLEQVLGVRPGSVTPFALVNDAARRVSLVLDRAMMDAPLLNFHPLSNDRTTTIATPDFRRFLASTGHVPEIVAL
jgi:Ala-tRNA(Pro) deacylase